MTPCIIASIGKGGSGKTTVACGLAYYLASKGYETALFDCNKQGVGIARGLSPEGLIKIPRRPSPGELLDFEIKNLVGGALFDFQYKNLRKPDDKESMGTNRRDEEFEKYMKQLLGPYGVIAFNRLCGDLFGLFTSDRQAANFITLSELYHKAVDRNSRFIILDMPASVDFFHPFLRAANASYSVENMNRLGWTNLKLVERALRMPDVARFLRSDYVKNADYHAKRIRESAMALAETNFFLVCGSESEKVNEMLEDLQPLVDRVEKMRKEVDARIRTGIEVRRWEKGGKRGRRPGQFSPENINGRLNTIGYVINNLQYGLDTDESQSQERQVEKIRIAANQRPAGFYEVYHDKVLGGWDKCPDVKRQEALRKLGKKLLVPAGL